MLQGTAGRYSDDPGACFEDSTLSICSSVFRKERFLISGVAAQWFLCNWAWGRRGLPLGWVLSVGPGLSHIDALKASRERERERSSAFKFKSHSNVGEISPLNGNIVNKIVLIPCPCYFGMDRSSWLTACCLYFLFKRAVLQCSSLRAVLVVPDAVLHCAELDSLTPRFESVRAMGQLHAVFFRE